MQIEHENMENELWPNFYIVGAPRTGTTSLFEYLKNTPKILNRKLPWNI